MPHCESGWCPRLNDLSTGIGADMDALTQLAGLVIADLGGDVSMLEEHRDPSAFGSGWLLLGRATPRLRLVWDGRERCAFLQAPTATGEWVDIAGPVAAGDLSIGGAVAAPVRSLLEAARAELARS